MFDVAVFVPLLLGVIFTCVGAAIFIVGEKQKRYRNIETDGMIVGHQETTSSEGGITYKPIVKYIDENNEEVEGVSSLSKSWSLLKKFQVGTPVKIYYDPLDKTKILIDGYDQSFLTWFGLLFMGIGVFIFLIGIVVSLFI